MIRVNSMLFSDPQSALNAADLRRLIKFDELLDHVHGAGGVYVDAINAYLSTTTDQAERDRMITRISTCYRWSFITAAIDIIPADAIAHPQIRDYMNGHFPCSLQWADELYRDERCMPWKYARWLWVNRDIRCSRIDYPPVCTLAQDCGPSVVWDILLAKGAHLTDDEIERLDFKKLWPVLSSPCGRGRSATPPQYGQSILYFRGFTLIDLQRLTRKKWSMWPMAQNRNDTVANLVAWGSPVCEPAAESIHQRI